MVRTDAVSIVHDRRVLWLTISLQLMLAGVIWLSSAGHDVPLLRASIAFVYLTFVPGILILRILRIPGLSILEEIAYTVGLSLAFTMLLGALLNQFYSFLGFSRPLSILPLTITFSFAVQILWVIAYFRPGKLNASFSLKSRDILSPPFLFLILIPLLALLGVSVVNAYSNSSVLLGLIVIIAFLVGLVTFNKFIPSNLYPLAIWVIGISLLWHWSMISPHVNGPDVQPAYRMANLVLAGGVWNPTYPFADAALLNVSVGWPIYSIMMNIDVVWILKLINPFFFSLVPLVLFELYKKQIPEKLAFLAAFLFMSFFVFFEFTHKPEMQAAELFVALILLLFSEREMAHSRRNLLLIIFGFSLVVSHYGTSYIFAAFLAMAFVVLKLINISTILLFWNRITVWVGGKTSETMTGSIALFKEAGTLRLSFVLLFIIFCLGWYMYVATGRVMTVIVDIGSHVYNAVWTDFFSLEARGSWVGTMMGQPLLSPSVQRDILRVLVQVTQLFIVIGFIRTILDPRKSRFQPEFLTMALSSLALLAGIIVLPYFGAAIDTPRTYHIALLWLAPFGVLGGKVLFGLLAKLGSLVFRRISASDQAAVLMLVMLILIPHFLFETGFIYQITGDRPSSTALSPGIDARSYNWQEVSGAKWLASNTDGRIQIYADAYAGSLLMGWFPQDYLGGFQESFKTPEGVFIFLRSLNVKGGKALVVTYRKYAGFGGATGITYMDLRSSSAYEELFDKHNLIYANGGAEIYR